MTTETVCVHHYVLEAPHGPVIVGACRKCGEVREYSASYDEQRWAHLNKRGTAASKAALAASQAEKRPIGWGRKGGKREGAGRKPATLR